MSIPSDKAAYIRELQNKIKTLQFLGSNLDGSTVEFLLTFDCKSRVKVDQHLIPFNLVMELRALIGDSIDHYQRIITNINSLADEIY